MTADLHFLESLFWLLFVWNVILTICLIALFSFTMDRQKQAVAKLSSGSAPCAHCPALSKRTDGLAEVHAIVTKTSTNKPKTP